VRCFLALLSLALAPLALAAGSLEPQSPAVRERELDQLDARVALSISSQLVRLRDALHVVSELDLPLAADAQRVAAMWDERVSEPLTVMRERAMTEIGIDADVVADAARRARETLEATEWTPESARTVIDQARRVAEFDAPPPTTQLLLSFDRTYAADGLAQLAQGLVTRLEVDGSGGARGFRAELDIPRSWMLSRSYGDAAVARARSLSGEGLASVTLSVVPLAEDAAADRDAPPLDAVAHRVTPEGVARFHPSAALIESGSARALGRDALFATRREDLSSRHGVVRGFVKEYLTVIGGNVIKIEAAVTDSGRTGTELLDLETLRAEFRRVEPLFDELVRRWAPVSSAP